MSRMTQLFRKGSWRLTSRWRSESSRDIPAPQAGSAAPPRIAILSASAGSGHIRAAAAIETALRQILPEAVVENVDVLKLTNMAIRRAYSAGYFKTVAAAPHLIGMMYDLLDRPSDKRLADRARIVFERLNFTRLTRFLTAEHWDLAISTHFLPPGLLAGLRRSGRIDFPHATVVTDFDVHGLWINQPCERYFVATEEARANIIAWGVGEDQVRVTGIPIDPEFARPADRNEARRKFGLDLDRPVILQMAGGFGVGPIEAIFRSIREIETPLQLVVVTGKNTDAKLHLESLPPVARHRCKILEFTTEIRDLMCAADIVVSKPGGLTTAESLACGCAMVVVDPIPGQEDRNADYLMENGCAIKVNNLSGLTHKLGALLAEPGRLMKLRNAARDCGRPGAAFDVARECLGLLPSGALGLASRFDKLTAGKRRG
jgi:processive 1,2-diacylglycerol beta-glucosyltransferase